jgi:hypothetical protein
MPYLSYYCKPQQQRPSKSKARASLGFVILTPSIVFFSWSTFTKILLHSAPDQYQAVECPHVFSSLISGLLPLLSLLFRGVSSPMPATVVQPTTVPCLGSRTVVTRLVPVINRDNNNFMCWDVLLISICLFPPSVFP